MKSHKKFEFAHRTSLGFKIAAVVCFILYIVLTTCLENIEYLQTKNFLYYMFFTCSQTAMIAFSIMATSIASNWFVEVKHSNDAFYDILCNDFLASDTFYNALTEDNRKKLLTNLEKQFYFTGNEPVEKMYSSIREKLSKETSIYYESCIYVIECDITDSYIKKRITRTASIKSCKEDIVEKKFSFATTRFKPGLNHSNNSTIESVLIDKIPIPPNHRKEVRKPVNDHISKKNGYTHIIQHIYKKDLILTPQKSTEVKVEYETFSPPTDFAYVCRVGHPCKTFSFTFKLVGKNADKYELSSHTFGFAEEAEDNGSVKSRTSINVKFKDWIFPEDGIAIAICPKSNA